MYKYFILLLVINKALAEDDLGTEWYDFKRKFGKSYSTQMEEYDAYVYLKKLIAKSYFLQSFQNILRFNIWKTNSERIRLHNQKADEGFSLFKIEMNSWGDLVNLS